MHVITRKRLREFCDEYVESEDSLSRWYKIVSTGRFGSFSELRNTFNSVDKAGKFTIFNVGGNHYRVIAVLHYNRQKLCIRHVLTHAEYDRGGWK